MNISELPGIGQPLNGGFFAGKINCEGKNFAIIVAPKAAGFKSGIQWGGAGNLTSATSYNDGSINTLALAESNHDLGHWALALNLNEFNDWYIPSRDELEIIYRNLKPGSENNCCSFRDGENPSAIEYSERFPYTPALPAQTIAPEFQADGSEAFEGVWHWSSTQYSAHGAWLQDFDDGYQYGSHKHGTCAARAVRRELII
ncbi:MAG: DUF1566 domain-containing protein [Pseudomonadota bacterium]